jgi:hypothetical protein
MSDPVGLKSVHTETTGTLPASANITSFYGK